MPRWNDDEGRSRKARLGSKLFIRKVGQERLLKGANQNLEVMM